MSNNNSTFNLASITSTPGSATQTAEESLPLFSSPEEDKIQIDLNLPSQSVFKQEEIEPQPGTSKPSIFESVKNKHYTNEITLDSSEEDEEQWPVRYRIPTITKKGEFNVPYQHQYNDGKYGVKSVTYFICREQADRGSVLGVKPFTIRPSFVTRRRRHGKISPLMDKWITSAPLVKTPISSSDNFQDAQVMKDEDHDTSITDIFNNPSPAATPPPVTPSPPVTPPPVTSTPLPRPSEETVVTVETTGHRIKIIVTPK
jgi:hypothetical protein